MFYVPSSGIGAAYTAAENGAAQEDAAIGIYLMAWMTVTFLFLCVFTGFDESRTLTYLTASGPCARTSPSSRCSSSSPSPSCASVPRSSLATLPSEQRAARLALSQRSSRSTLGLPSSWAPTISSNCRLVASRPAHARHEHRARQDLTSRYVSRIYPVLCRIYDCYPCTIALFHHSKHIFI